MVKEQTLFRQSALFVELLITLHKNVSKWSDKKREKIRVAGDLENRWTERTPQKCFRCGSQDHPISKSPKPPKEKDKQRNEVRLNKKGNRVCENGENNSEQDIYDNMTVTA